jgi:hypothetical protein
LILPFVPSLNPMVTSTSRGHRSMAAILTRTALPSAGIPQGTR